LFARVIIVCLCAFSIVSRIVDEASSLVNAAGGRVYNSLSTK
jgi:hypothetical protein